MTAPFPDGIGFIDIAWSSLSPAQRRVLAVVYRSGSLADCRVSTLRVLRAYNLVTTVGAAELTDRGRVLMEWAHTQGLVS